MDNFEKFGLSHSIMTALTNMQYTTPTPIQAQAIPLALQGRDIMGTAQTGTGKTAAFAIPLIEHLLSSHDSGSALVLTPTRELGKQVMEVMHQLLGKKSKINTAFIIGGEPYFKQMNQLKNNPRLIVGTPGRINDHLEQGTLKLNDTHFLVLDETDRMLDMGFSIQLERIFKFMPAQRQTLMFSATMPKEIKRMTARYLVNPQHISIGEVNTLAQNINQEMMRIEQPQKYDELKQQLTAREGSVIVFVKTKHGADKMAKNLRRDGFTSDALHGDLRQNRRDKVMMNFRKQNFRVLIATDIAARGLDVPHIEHVVNYDLPQVAEDFIHRIGRTARAGAEGHAISFIASHDNSKWRMIERLIDPEAAANDKGNGASRKNSRKDRFKNKKRGNKNRENFAGYEEDVKVEHKKSFKKKRTLHDDKKGSIAPKTKKRHEDTEKSFKKDSAKPRHSTKEKESRFENSGKKPWRDDKKDNKKHASEKPTYKKAKTDGERSFDKSSKSVATKKSAPKNGAFKAKYSAEGHKQTSRGGKDAPAFRGKKSGTGKPISQQKNDTAQKPSRNSKPFNGKSASGKNVAGKSDNKKSAGGRSQKGQSQNRNHFAAPNRRNKAA